MKKAVQKNIEQEILSFAESKGYILTEFTGTDTVSTTDVRTIMKLKVKTPTIFKLSRIVDKHRFFSELTKYLQDKGYGFITHATTGNRHDSYGGMLHTLGTADNVLSFVILDEAKVSNTTELHATTMQSVHADIYFSVQAITYIGWTKSDAIDKLKAEVDKQKQEKTTLAAAKSKAKKPQAKLTSAVTKVKQAATKLKAVTATKKGK